jgi:1-acyl-sn-glycerol-3-phosphate acyltransferase
MNFGAVKHLFYGLYLTNTHALRLRKMTDPQAKKRERLRYAKRQLGGLGISVVVDNPEKIPATGQYLLIANHRSIIDPPIIEMALADTDIYGLWVSKKELYNSPFFGMFVRHGGSVLLDREQNQMGGFFADIKAGVKAGSSIFIFPEGTRNKTEEPLGEFKGGSRIIALKNRLPILPVYIKTHAGQTLKAAIADDKTPRTIHVEFGDPMDYKTREDLATAYREQFGI